MSGISSKIAVGIAVALSSAELTAHTDCGELPHGGFGALEMPKATLRPLVVVGKNADISQMTETDPIAVIVSLPQHKQLEFAKTAAFLCVLNAQTVEDQRSITKLLSAEINALPEYSQKDAVISGMGRAFKHQQLLDSLPGLDQNSTNRSGLYCDRALRDLVDVHAALTNNTSGGSSPHIREIVQVTRNLYFGGQPVSETNAMTALRHLREERGTYFNIELFAGRAVIMAAHSERITDVDSKTGEPLRSTPEAERLVSLTGDDHRFGKVGLQKLLRGEVEQYGGTFHSFRAENAREGPAIKERVLEAISQTPPWGCGFTFLFDGHGGKDELCISSEKLRHINDKTAGASEKKGVSITAMEFAEAYRKRAATFPANFGSLSAQRDIVVVVGCYSQDFIRNLGALLSDLPYPPILLSAAEFSQYSFSDLQSPLGSGAFRRTGLPSFFESSSLDFLLPPPPVPITIGTFLEHGNSRDRSPSLFVPDARPQPAGKEKSRFRQYGFNSPASVSI